MPYNSLNKSSNKFILAVLIKKGVQIGLNFSPKKTTSRKFFGTKKREGERAIATLKMQVLEGEDSLVEL
jgi:hypothetical protein